MNMTRVILVSILVLGLAGLVYANGDDPYLKDCVDACVDYCVEPDYCKYRCETFFRKLKPYLDKMEYEEHRHFYKSRAASCFREAEYLNEGLNLGWFRVEDCLKRVIRDAYKQTKRK